MVVVVTMILANVALPAFLPHSLATLAGIFVIAAMEGWFLMRGGLGLDYDEGCRHALRANWMSTIWGIPVAWLLWLAGMVPVSLGLSALGLSVPPVVQSALLFTAVSGGTVPSEWELVASAAAWIFMLVPFWMGSVWIERRVIQQRLPAADPALISRAVIRGNLASYSLFLLVGLAGLFYALADLPERQARYQERRVQREKARAERMAAPEKGR